MKRFFSLFVSGETYDGPHFILWNLEVRNIIKPKVARVMTSDVTGRCGNKIDFNGQIICDTAKFSRPIRESRVPNENKTKDIVY
jgi:hypothetical protein